MTFPFIFPAGSDYTFTTTEVSFQPGFFATTVEVPIIEDRVAEGEEMFQGTLTTANGANVLITESRADVTINDNDGMLTILAAILTVLPGNFKP